MREDIASALKLSEALETQRLGVPQRSATPRRFFAIGDPQTSRARFFSVLAHHGLLGEDGFLLPEAGLLSMGDHFDYAGERDEVSREGLLLLRWLAEHPATQVALLAGNHDLCRVMELAPLSDASFAKARTLAAPLREAKQRGEEVGAAAQAFFKRFPTLPSPGIACKDFMGYSEAQRALVQSLLLAGRFSLARAAKLESGDWALLTHAAVTRREVELLGCGVDVRQISRALNARLHAAVEAVRPAWEAGHVETPLDLSPLHIAGSAGREGGGLLYHRPANPARLGADTRWERNEHAPRRFDPRRLPPALLQVCGHSGHAKNLKELEGWLHPSAREAEHGGPRTLCVRGEQVSYEWGLSVHSPPNATLYLIDAEMNIIEPEAYPLLPLHMLAPKET